MHEDLATLYEVLKDGHSRGVVINHSFETADSDQLRKIYNRAINEGFAQVPAITSGYGSELTLQLTQEGRHYPTYQAYCDRHKKPEMSIANSILGNNNSSNNVGQDFEVLPQSQPISNPSQNANQSKAHKVEIATGQFVFWLFSAFATGIGIGFAIANYLHK